MATGALTWVDVIQFVGIPAFFGGILQVAHELRYGPPSSEKQHRPAGGAPPKTMWAGFLALFIGDYSESAVEQQ